MMVFRNTLMILDEYWMSGGMSVDECSMKVLFVGD
jgi:hypothetical protein